MPFCSFLVFNLFNFLSRTHVKEEESLWLSGKHIDYYRALQLVTTKMESPSSGLRNPTLFD